MAAPRQPLRIVDEKHESAAYRAQKIAVFRVAAALKTHFESTY
jgi:hypothetical protein